MELVHFFTLSKTSESFIHFVNVCFIKIHVVFSVVIALDRVLSSLLGEYLTFSSQHFNSSSLP